MADAAVDDGVRESVLADLRVLRRRVRNAAEDSDAIGMFCHDEFAAIDAKIAAEIQRVGKL